MNHDFFIPFADSAARAERIYDIYIKKTGHPLAHPESRIRRLNFRRYKNDRFVAEVGREIPYWCEPGGRVFAIIEFTVFFQIFTTFCAWLHPIRILPHEVIEKAYFDDYPAKD